MELVSPAELRRGSALGFASAGAACKRVQRSGSQPPYHKELLSRTLASRFATESANIIQQIPNAIRGFNFAEGSHSGETDSVLDDPKQLLVGKTLHLLAGEVGGAWITDHYGAQMHLRICASHATIVHL